MESAECPECLSAGPHHVFSGGRLMECILCRAVFDNPTWIVLDEPLAWLEKSRARWQELADELMQIMDPFGHRKHTRSARRTEYRRRVRTRTRSRR